MAEEPVSTALRYHFFLRLQGLYFTDGSTGYIFYHISPDAYDGENDHPRRSPWGNLQMSSVHKQTGSICRLGVSDSELPPIPCRICEGSILQASWKLVAGKRTWLELADWVSELLILT